MRPLRFGQEFISLLHQADARQKIRKRWPNRKRGHCRILASDGSIQDFPQRFIDDALTLDQRWSFQHGFTSRFTLLDNDALVKFDRGLWRTYRMVMAAYFGPQRQG